MLASREHDVVIVGGGIYGACLAWEAAQRGLRTGLIEARDFGCGTSWNSLKTIHGGIRHLQRFDLGSFRQSVRERRTLLRIAGGLVRPLPAVVPIYGHGLRGREAFAAGLALGNALSADRNDGVDETVRLDKARVVDATTLRRLVPGVPGEGLTGAACWTDAQARSTERLLLAFLHAAAGAGAVLANDVPVTAVLRDGNVVAGVRVLDKETGESVDVASKVVVNAAGPAAPLVARFAGAALEVPSLRAVNLVFSRKPDRDFAVGSAHEGRLLFLAPWEGRTLVGTGYAPPKTDRGTLAQELLAAAQRAFPWASLRGDEVVLVHDGLVAGERDASGLWSRHRIIDHGVSGGPSGLVSVVGVKYTTARAVAEAVVDLLARSYRLPASPSRTASTPLAMLEAAGNTLEERTRFAVREEMARSVEDVVLRRLDLGTRGTVAPEELRRVTAAFAEVAPR